jgi:hypothetical protein
VALSLKRLLEAPSGGMTERFLCAGECTVICSLTCALNRDAGSIMWFLKAVKKFLIAKRSRLSAREDDGALSASTPY